MKTAKKIIMLCCILFIPLFTMTACDPLSIKDAAEEFSKSLESIMENLAKEGDKWRIAIQKEITELEKEINALEDKIAKDIDVEVNKMLKQAKEMLKEELEDFMKSAMADVRCEIDFLLNRLVGTLTNLQVKVHLLTDATITIEEAEKKFPEYLKMLDKPVICNASPYIIDIKKVRSGDVNHVELSGYNFQSQAQNMSLYLKNDSETVNVTDDLTFPTYYSMVINLGSNGIDLTLQSKKLILKWNDEKITTMSVIYDITKVDYIITAKFFVTGSNGNATPKLKLIGTGAGSQWFELEHMNTESRKACTFNKESPRSINCYTYGVRLPGEKYLGPLSRAKVYIENLSKDETWYMDTIDIKISDSPGPGGGSFSAMQTNWTVEFKNSYNCWVDDYPPKPLSKLQPQGELSNPVKH